MPDAPGELLFDGAAEPLAGLWYGGITLGIVGLMLLWRFSGRSMPWFFPAGIAFVGTIVTASTTWDQMRIRTMLESGEGLQVTRGAIDQVWHIEERRRDQGSKDQLRYKTVVSEGLDLGNLRFSWTTVGCLSDASLCDLARSKRKLEKGMPVEVSWFKDPAQQNANRILRLRLFPAPATQPRLKGAAK